MKNKLKYIVSFIVFVFVINIVSYTTNATGAAVRVQTINVTMEFDGANLAVPKGQHIFAYQGRTYVPLRFVSYALQQHVQWDSKNKKVTVSEPTDQQRVSIQENLMNAVTPAKVATDASKILSVTPMNVDFMFNGQSKVMDKGQSSYMLNGTVYVPIRFLSESVGIVMKWDEKTKSITAESKGYQEVKLESDETDKKSDGKVTTDPNAGGGGAGAVAQSYESITSSTEAKLVALQAQSKSVLLGLVREYLDASDSATKSQLLEQAQQQLNGFTSKFESIVSHAENQLTTGNFSTAVIGQYRDEFQKELKAGKELAESLSE